MGRKKNRQKRFQALHKAQQNASVIFPRSAREEKAREVKLQLALLGLDENHQEIKKLNIILDLWVEHNRAHQELLDLPFVENKKIEIRLFNTKNKESKIVLKHMVKPTYP